MFARSQYKCTKALGLTVPATLLARSDNVMEYRDECRLLDPKEVLLATDYCIARRCWPTSSFRRNAIARRLSETERTLVSEPRGRVYKFTP